MDLIVFSDKTKPPTDETLATTLGETYVVWNELKNIICLRFNPVIEWSFSSPKTGWGLRLKKDKRVILYMLPRQGYFLTSFVLGEKAVKAAHDSGLPKNILNVIDGAKQFAEGRSVKLEIRRAEDVLAVENLAIIKMRN